MAFQYFTFAVEIGHEVVVNVNSVGAGHFLGCIDKILDIFLIWNL